MSIDNENIILSALLGHKARIFKKYPLVPEMFTKNNRIIVDALKRDLPERDLYSILEQSRAKQMYEVHRDHGKNIGYSELSDAFHDQCVELGIDVETDEGIFDVMDVIDELEDMKINGVPRGKFIGWHSLNDLLTLTPGELVMVHGWPGSGKSEWVDAIMVNLSHTDGYRHAVFSPENQPFKLHFQKIMEKHIGKAYGNFSDEEMVEATQFCQEHFRLVLPTERDTTVEKVLERFDRVHKKFGVNVCVIDPFDELEQKKARSEAGTDFVNRQLIQIRRFGRDRQISMIVVHHPQKAVGSTGDEYTHCPRPQAMHGSARFYNRADAIVAVHRDKLSSRNHVEIHVQKIRHKPTGRIGKCTLDYDYITGRYSE